MATTGNAACSDYVNFAGHSPTSVLCCDPVFACSQCGTHFQSEVWCRRGDVGMHAGPRHVAHPQRAAAAAAPRIRAPPPTPPLAAMTVRVWFLVRQAHCCENVAERLDADFSVAIAAYSMAGQRAEPRLLRVCRRTTCRGRSQEETGERRKKRYLLHHRTMLQQACSLTMYIGSRMRYPIMDGNAGPLLKLLALCCLSSLRVS